MAHYEHPQVTPKWWSPPDDLIGGILIEQLLVAKDDRLAIIISRIVAYPMGFTVNLAVLSHAGYELPPFMPTPSGRAIGLGATPPQLTPPQPGGVLGWRFADGTNISADAVGHPLIGVRSMDTFARLTEPPQPFVSCVGGGGHGRRQDWTFWIAPLPPPGSLEVYVRWESVLQNESRAILKADSILSAAARSTTVWDD